MADARETFQELVKLRDGAGELLFRRLKLARELLADKGWVTDRTGGGGDEGKALDRLESECFADVCGVVGLAGLLDLLTHFPQESQWRKARWNARKLWAELSERRKAAPKKPAAPRPASPLPTPEEFEQMTPAKQRASYERAARLAENEADRIARLTEENAALKEENARLREENARLKKGLLGLARGVKVA